MSLLQNRLLRFETFAAVIAGLLLVLLAYVHMPYAENLLRRGGELYGFWGIASRTAELNARNKVVQKENLLLDSLMKTYDRNMRIDDNSIATTLYSRADSSGLKTSKIEIGEKTVTGGNREIPVSIQGYGSYAAVGKFCEAVENLPVPARIRLVSAEGTGRGNVKTVIDFVLLSQLSKKGE